MKIQNKINRYAVNATAVNFEAQVRKMQKAIALAERELEQARQMFADFNSAPVPPAPKKFVVHSSKGTMTAQSEVHALLMDTDKTVAVAVEEAVKEEPVYKGLDLTPAPATPEPEYKGLDLSASTPEPEYKGLDLTPAPKPAPLVKEVRENMAKPAPKPVQQPTQQKAGFLSGPAQSSNVLNSAMPSHKHNTLQYVDKLKKFIFSGIMKLAEAGIREIRVAEFYGVELLTALVWPSVLAKCPDMELILYTNEKKSFKQYKTEEYEATFKIHSPYRLQQDLRRLANKVVKVEGGAFAVRRAVAKDTAGYVRISPFGLEDITTPLFSGKTLRVHICPWTLAVEVGGDLPALSLTGDGGDYRPRQMVADEKLSAADTSDYKGLTLS